MIHTKSYLQAVSKKCKMSVVSGRRNYGEPVSKNVKNIGKVREFCLQLPIDIYATLKDPFSWVCQIGTARIRRLTEGNVFTNYVHHRGGGLSPSHNTSTGPVSFPGGTPVTGPRSLLGCTSVPGGGTPGRVIPWDTPLARTGWVNPWPGLG